MEHTYECFGCRDELANQEAHMEPGGCLYKDIHEVQKEELDFFKRAEKMYWTEKYQNDWKKGSFVIITRQGQVICLTCYSVYKEVVSKLDEPAFTTRVGFENTPVRI